MKKTYSTLVLLLGIGLGGFLFAQQSKEPESGEPYKEKNQPDEKINVQKDVDEDGNVVRMDSTWSWNWSWDKEIPENFQDRLQEFFNEFGDGFTFHFNDSTLSGKRFNEFFNEDFGQELESLQDLDEKFNEDFLERLNEKLGKLQDEDIHFQWDKNFNRHLEQGIEQMRQKWQKFYQEYQQDNFQTQRKAL